MYLPTIGFAGNNCNRGVFDQRWKHIDWKYDWDKWSMDRDFWNSTYQALWSETPIILDGIPDLDERLCFLGSFESISKDKVRGVGGKSLSFLKRLYRGQRITTKG